MGDARTPEPAGTGRRLRRDAAANKERLLTAARELFAEHGVAVTLNDIAHHAGVGVGTAYRRFANKNEVLDALFVEQTAEMAAIADAALAHPDAWLGLVSYLEALMALQLRDKALSQILAGDQLRVDQHDWKKEILAPKVNAIAARAKVAGLLRADAEGTDLVFLQVGLSAIIDRTRGFHPDLYRRYLQLALDSLRASCASTDPLPVPALTTDETHAVMGPGPG